MGDAADDDDLRPRAHLLRPHRSSPLPPTPPSRTPLPASPSTTPPPPATMLAPMSQPGAFDPSSLHPLAGLNQDTLDYLTLDDTALSDLPGSRSALPSRGWSDDLCYGTGVTYLAALSIG